jgi:hypothetical protein
MGVIPNSNPKKAISFLDVESAIAYYLKFIS